MRCSSVAVGERGWAGAVGSAKEGWVKPIAPMTPARARAAGSGIMSGLGDCADGLTMGRTGRGLRRLVKKLARVIIYLTHDTNSARCI